MASMTEIICACGCGRKKKVRTADIKRGWGKYYSKSCKAKAQTKRTGKGKPKKVKFIDTLRTSSLYRSLERKQGMPDDIAREIINEKTKQEGLSTVEQDMLWYDLTMHPFSSEALGQD